MCLEDGDEFPCDMVLLATSNSNGKASILTANLDGETNLKNQIAPGLTRTHRADQLLNLKAQIECENPNPDLQGFVGRMTVEGTTDDTIPAHSLRRPSRLTLHAQVIISLLSFNVISKAILHSLIASYRFRFNF